MRSSIACRSPMSSSASANTPAPSRGPPRAQKCLEARDREAESGVPCTARTRCQRLRPRAAGRSQRVLIAPLTGSPGLRCSRCHRRGQALECRNRFRRAAARHCRGCHRRARRSRAVRRAGRGIAASSVHVTSSTTIVSLTTQLPRSAAADEHRSSEGHSAPACHRPSADRGFAAVRCAGVAVVAADRRVDAPERAAASAVHGCHRCNCAPRSGPFARDRGEQEHASCSEVSSRAPCSRSRRMQAPDVAPVTGSHTPHRLERERACRRPAPRELVGAARHSEQPG